MISDVDSTPSNVVSSASPQPPLTEVKSATSGLVFFVNAWLDVCDVVKKWCEAQVIAIAEGKIKVRYRGWHDKWNEWIDVEKEASRIAPINSITGGGPKLGKIRCVLGERCDAHYSGNWHETVISDVNARHRQVKVHFVDLPMVKDQWFDFDSYRLAPLHSAKYAALDRSYWRSALLDAIKSANVTGVERVLAYCRDQDVHIDKLADPKTAPMYCLERLIDLESVDEEHCDQRKERVANLETIMVALCEAKASMGITFERWGETVLLRASQMLTLNMFNLFLSFDADVTKVDNTKRNALHYFLIATRSVEVEDRLRLMREFLGKLEEHAKRMVNAPQDSGRTPLMMLCSIAEPTDKEKARQYARAVDLLLDFGAKPSLGKDTETGADAVKLAGNAENHRLAAFLTIREYTRLHLDLRTIKEVAQEILRFTFGYEWFRLIDGDKDVETDEESEDDE